MRRYALRDDQWERIKDLLPGREGWVGVTAKDNRLFVEAVLYRYRAGIPWRDLPERFGAWKKVHTRFCRWAKTGVWERVFRHLAGDADDEYAMIDSTIVRAHQHSAGAIKKGAATRRSGAAGAAWAPRSMPRSTRSATRPGSPSRPGRRTTSTAPTPCCRTWPRAR
jgi:transposase